MLTPAAVHPDTAYRYYSPGQLASLARSEGGGEDNLSVVVADVCA